MFRPIKESLDQFHDVVFAMLTLVGVALAGIVVLILLWLLQFVSSWTQFGPVGTIAVAATACVASAIVLLLRRRGGKAGNSFTALDTSAGTREKPRERILNHPRRKAHYIPAARPGETAATTSLRDDDPSTDGYRVPPEPKVDDIDSLKCRILASIQRNEFDRVESLLVILERFPAERPWCADQRRYKDMKQRRATHE